jgi:neutral ceramidase
VLLIALILLGILSIPWRGDRPFSPPVPGPVASGHGALQAGAAARTIDLGPSPIIGGFPRWRWTAEGVRDPVWARALVLAEPGCTVAVVSVEVLLVPEVLAEAVRARTAGLGLDAVLVVATHTHAGPGGYWDSLVGRLAATGPYDPATFERVVDAAAGAIRDARGALAPATLSVARGRSTELTYNRTGAAPDGRLLWLRVARPGGEPVAELVELAAHPTLLGKENRRVSGDWPGALAASVPGRLRLVLQGAIGDQSARVEPTEREQRPALFAARVAGALEALVPGVADGAPRLAVASAEVALPPLAPGAVPGPLRPATRTLLGGVLPATARVTALRLGPILLLATPAEPVEAVGHSWRSAAGPDAELVSLADGYVGYVDTAERFRSGAGEARRSYYGPELAARLERAVVEAGHAADGAAAARP